MKKVTYNDNIIQWKRLYNYLAIIRQRKMYNIYRQRLQCKYHSSMYSSKAVGRRRIRTGRPEPEADWDWDWDSVSPQNWLSWSIPGRDWVSMSGVSSPSVSVWESGGTPESTSGTTGGGVLHKSRRSTWTVCLVRLAVCLIYHHQWRLEGFDAPRSGP